MGYYTDYTLMLKNAKPEETDMLNDRLTNIESGWGLEWWDDETYYVNAKWYEHQEDMRKLSAEFPDVLFTLHGIGENCEEDLWYEYYKGGKMQFCPGEVVYPQYDEKKLK